MKFYTAKIIAGHARFSPFIHNVGGITPVINGVYPRLINISPILKETGCASHCNGVQVT